MLSPQSKYALRALMYLQRLRAGEYVKIETIAADTKLPAPYLAKMVKALVENKLLVARRGKHGGVQLAERPLPPTFYEVCHAVGEPILASECILLKRLCNHRAPCAFHTRWSRTKERLIAFLKETRIDQEIAPEEVG